MKNIYFKNLNSFSMGDRSDESLKIRIIVILLIAFTFILLLWSLLSEETTLLTTGNTDFINEVTYISPDETKTLQLPTIINDVTPSSNIVIESPVNIDSGEVLLIKSVFSRIKVFLDDEQVYSYGYDNDFPSFLNDPPTKLSFVYPDTYNSPSLLRIEYQSPSQRTNLSLPRILIGDEAEVTNYIFREDRLPFIFALLFIFFGLMIMVISLPLFFKDYQGNLILLLGLFSLLAGIWCLGATDYSAFIISRPTLLYIIEYGGLFTLSIPFIQFVLTFLNPKNKLPLKATLYLHILSALVAFLLQLTGLVDFTKSLYWFHIIILLAFIVFVVYLLWEYIKYKNPFSKQFGIPILVMTISVLLQIVNYWNLFIPSFTVFFQLGLLIFIIVLCISSGRYIKESINIAAEREALYTENAVMNRQLELQNDQYLKLMADETNIKAQRHDLRHQLTVLHELNKVGDTTSVSQYLKELLAKIPSVTDHTYSENFTVNAIASYYFSIAKTEKTKIDFVLAVPKVLHGISQSDLAILTGNLLENAVEACSKIEENKRFISMNMRLQGNALVITLDNSFNGEVEYRDNMFFSSKREGEGIGLSSVTAVAKKYNGSTRFEAKGTVFRSSVFILLEE